MHDLDERRLAGLLGDGQRGPDDRTHLHLVDLRVEEPEPAAARPQHRVRLAERPDPARHLLRLGFLERRQELVQRRVEQADGDRQPGHGREDPLEVGLLEGEQPLQLTAALVLGSSQDHCAHERQPALCHEHVLGPAEADAFGAELPCFGGVLGRVRVRAHAKAADLVRPAEQRPEALVDPGRDEGDLADDHVAGAAVDREDVAFGQLVVTEADAPRAEVDRERLAA